MNREEEIRKVQWSIDCLRFNAKDSILKEHSEAASHGADILEDYLKYLKKKLTSGLSCTS